MAENSGKTAVRTKRAPGRPFKPGVSGNAGGRPKGLAEMQALCREHTPAAVEALVRGLEHPKLFVAAALGLLDRGWGKPSQPIEGDAGFPGLLAVLEARRQKPGG